MQGLQKETKGCYLLSIGKFVVYLCCKTSIQIYIVKMNKNIICTQGDLESKIYTIRGLQVMLDYDLAQIYGYEVKRLNEQVKRNIARFPEDFMFQLNRDEVEMVKSQIATSRKNTLFIGQEGGTRKLCTKE